jgi:hypothetical protein
LEHSVLEPVRGDGLGAISAICVLPLLLYAPLLLEPFERDEGVYATMAQGLLRGEVPYRDLFDHKPPLVFVYYAISFLAFGEGVLAPRLLASLFWSATTLLIYRQGRMLFPETTARIAAVLFSLSSGFVLLQATANTEAFMLLPLTASVLALGRGLRDGSGKWFLIAGVCAAIAALTKQVALLNLLTLGGLGLLYGLYWSRPRSKWPALAAIFGAVGVFVAALVPFALTGALDDFYYATVRYNVIYGGQVTLFERIENEAIALLLFTRSGAPLVVGALLALPTLRKALGSRDALLLGSWLLASYAGATAGGYAFPHYYVALLPSLALIAAIGLQRAFEGGHARPVGVLVVGVSFAMAAAFNGSIYLLDSPEDRHIARYPEGHAERHIQSPEVGAYIASITSPDDKIYETGRDSQLYFYADRRPATRFFYDRPLHLEASHIAATIAELRATPPALIIDSGVSRDDDIWSATHPPDLIAFIQDRYEFVVRVGFTDIYQVKTTR